MLGSLARWLRVLGFDVHYDPRLDDAGLVELAVAEQRLILTRDSRLIRRRKARDHLFVRSEAVAEQIRQILDELEVELLPHRFLGRCLRCNEPLSELPLEQARGRVPPYVARTQKHFRCCPACQRIYWRATHVERMYGRLAAMGLGSLSEDS
jgi:uncharacterized protein with PIN domain